MGAAASLNLAARFLCEVAALTALAVWGAQAGDGVVVHVALAIAAPVLGVAVWGAFVAPRARRRAPDPLRAGIEVVFFGAAVAGLAVAGHAALAVVLGVAAAITGALVRVWPEPVERRRG